MKLNIKNYLSTNNIFFREHGSGVKKGNIVIQCPFCGASDKGQHLGISISNGVWGCWRDEGHRSKDLAKLLNKLTGISYEQARKLIGSDHTVINTSDFDELLADNFFKAENKKKTRIKTLLLPNDFRNFDCLFSTPFINYLKGRGFSEIYKLTKIYKLRFALTGDYRGRIILPVVFNNQLVTWTSRAISDTAQLRYRSLSEEDSSVNIKNTIYNYDRAIRKTGKVLFVVEGPIDCLKMDFYLRGLSAHAVGLHSMTISDDQLYWLVNLFDSYKKVVLLLDKGEIASSTKGIAKLESTGKEIQEGVLPKGVNDPGELLPAQVKKLFYQWSK